MSCDTVTPFWDLMSFLYCPASKKIKGIEYQMTQWTEWTRDMTVPLERVPQWVKAHLNCLKFTSFHFSCAGAAGEGRWAQWGMLRFPGGLHQRGQRWRPEDKGTCSNSDVNSQLDTLDVPIVVMRNLSLLMTIDDWLRFKVKSYSHISQ